MFFSKGQTQNSLQRAISTTVVAIIIVVIVVAAGASAFVVFNHPSTTTSSSSTTATTTTSTTSTTTSSTSTTTTSSSTSTTTASTTTTNTTSSSTSSCSSSSTTTNNSPGIDQTIFPLIKNFTKVSLNETGADNGTPFNENSSYVVTSTPSNSSQYYIMNVTSAGTTDKIWLYGNGTAYRIVSPTINDTGGAAQLDYFSVMDPYYLVVLGASFLSLPGVNSSAYTITNTTALKLGSIHVNQTVYQFNQAFLASLNACQSFQFENLTIGIGTVTGTNLPLGLLFYEAENLSGSNIALDIHVTSLTKVA